MAAALEQLVDRRLDHEFAVARNRREVLDLALHVDPRPELDVGRQGRIRQAQAEHGVRQGAAVGTEQGRDRVEFAQVARVLAASRPGGAERAESGLAQPLEPLAAGGGTRGGLRDPRVAAEHRCVERAIGARQAQARVALGADDTVGVEQLRVEALGLGLDRDPEIAPVVERRAQDRAGMAALEPVPAPGLHGRLYEIGVDGGAGDQATAEAVAPGDIVGVDAVLGSGRLVEGGTTPVADLGHRESVRHGLAHGCAPPGMLSACGSTASSW